MLDTISIEGYTSFPGIRWRLKDPTTELVLRVEGTLEPHTLEQYRQWFERRFARCFRFAEERFPEEWLANPEADPLAVHLAAGITALQRLGCQPVRRTQVLEAQGSLLRLALPSFNGTVLEGAIRLGIQLMLSSIVRLRRLQTGWSRFSKRSRLLSSRRLGAPAIPAESQ